VGQAGARVTVSHSDELTDFLLATADCGTLNSGDGISHLFHTLRGSEMFARLSVVVLAMGMFLLSGGLTGQEPKKDPKEPVGKVKGFLPNNWKKIGLSEDQVQQIYKIQKKYDDEIDKLEAKIAELKVAKDKERKAVLTPDQKKKLDEILTGKEK
jgi:hypothetical protein